MPQTVRVADPTAPTLEIYQSHANGKSVGTIAMCTRDRIGAGTVISWLMSDLHSFLEPDENISLFIIQGHVLTLQRNEAVQRMEGDWIIFIDDDMTFQRDAIKRLVTTHRENNLDMVGGLCFQRGEPYQPTLYMREEPTKGAYVFLEDWKDNEVVEVDATGMAFVLITRRLLEAIAGEFPPLEVRVRRRPPAYFRWDENGFGEDLTFCQDAKKTGAKIFVDTGIKIGHVGEQTITHATFLEQLARRSTRATEMRRELNDGLGLPTLNRKQAAAKLKALHGVG